MAAPILSLRDVRLADGARLMFDGVDLGLERRVRACLVGRNGAGKSTLLRILAGTVATDGGERFATPGLKVALVAQEPAIEGESLLAYASAGGAANHEAAAALESFGLDPARPTGGLSGGEARRAALARAFAEAPDVLLLDEPTNHLDILAIEALEARLARSPAAILVVSHDRAFLERVTTRCFWLENRRVRRLDGGFAKFEAWVEAQEAAEAETGRRLEKTLEREQHWLERGVTGRRARNEGRRRRLMALRQEKAERLRLSRGELALSTGGAVPSGKRVVEAKGLSKAYGERTLLSNFSTRIIRGDRVAIVGPNGAGKTTLVKILLGEIAPNAGSVVLGANLEIAYVDQARADLTRRYDPGPGPRAAGRRSGDGAGKAAPCGRLRRRLPVSRGSTPPAGHQPLGRRAQPPAAGQGAGETSNVMVLDEPTNDLDMETLDLLEEVLADYEGTLILVSHDRDFVNRLATSTIALNGRGAAVETPGGWTDFVEQNPGFLAVETPRTSHAVQARARPRAGGPDQALLQGPTPPRRTRNACPRPRRRHRTPGGPPLGRWPLCPRPRRLGQGLARPRKRPRSPRRRRNRVAGVGGAQGSPGGCAPLAPGPPACAPL